MTSTSVSIRELMPDNFIPKIQGMIRQAGMVAPAYQAISGFVKDERITSKYWRFVGALAIQEDPEAYEERYRELCEQRGIDPEQKWQQHLLDVGGLNTAA